MKRPAALVKLLLGHELRNIREDSGRKQTHVAKLAGLRQADLSKFESGTAGLDNDEIRRLLAIYGDLEPTVARHIESLLSENPTEQGTRVRRTGAQTAHPVDFRRFIDLEAFSQELRWFENGPLPGILQTEKYARALYQLRPELVADEGGLEQAVAARMARKRIFKREDLGRISVLLYEASIAQRQADLDAMREQLAHLAELALHPLLDIRVVPFSRPVSGAIVHRHVLFEIPAVTRPLEILYTETLEGPRYTADVSAVSLSKDMWSRMVEFALPKDGTLELINNYMEGWKR